MSALTGPRYAAEMTIKNKVFPLAGSMTAYPGGIACIDTNAYGALTPGAHSSTLIPVGQFLEAVDNSASTATSFCNVALSREILCAWYENATGANKVTSADLFSNVYLLDDHTVTKASSGNSLAGRVWDVSDRDGVLIQHNQW